MSKDTAVILCFFAAIVLFVIALCIAAGWINSTHHDAFVDGGLIAVTAAFLRERLP